MTREFPPLLRRGLRFAVPNGIIAHLTRECGGNVHDHNVVEVTCGSFARETYGANPHSGAYDNDLRWAAKNVADLETDSEFISAYRGEDTYIGSGPNNEVCYDFKERTIVPIQYAIRTHGCDPGASHLKSWRVETSTDGRYWGLVASEKDNESLNGRSVTVMFAVEHPGACRFIRLVNMGRTHNGTDCLSISAWEIFGQLIE
jgi:hypothetical protein